MLKMVVGRLMLFVSGCKPGAMWPEQPRTPLQYVRRQPVLLHHTFIDIAKKFGKKLAIHDFTTNRELTYARSLIASLILARFFGKLDQGFIGIMLPTSAGCILAKIGVLMSGRIPVMINYSTGAEHNARYAQQKCDFKTIITSKALLEKIECPYVDGMIYIEDIMAGITTGQKLMAAAIAALPAALIKKLVHQGQEDDTAVILFTSGSEKDPKAVQLDPQKHPGEYRLGVPDFQLSQRRHLHVHPALFPRLRPDDHLLAADLPRHDHAHLRQPPRFQKGLHHRQGT